MRKRSSCLINRFALRVFRLRVVDGVVAMMTTHVDDINCGYLGGS